MTHDSQKDIAEMPANEDTETARPKRKTRDRPDGTDPERYKGRERWSYKRWAWEFLRRNEKFKTECEQADSSASIEEKARIASEFGLRSYKSYKEPYKGKSGWPRFTIGLVTIISHLNRDQNQDRKVRLQL